jgi:hypothetical protein
VVSLGEGVIVQIGGVVTSDVDWVSLLNGQESMRLFLLMSFVKEFFNRLEGLMNNQNEVSETWQY